jgi:hypothetical protein
VFSSGSVGCSDDSVVHVSEIHHDGCVFCDTPIRYSQFPIYNDLTNTNRGYRQM